MPGKKEQVGIVGSGRMGLAMAKHLINKGYSLMVYDTNTDNLEKAVALGAKATSSPAELGKVVDFVILGVGYDEEVNAVVLGEDGLLLTLSAGSVIAVSSTVAPSTVKAIDSSAQAKGVHVLDAPICRGRWFADQGQLLALFGGSDEVVDRGKLVFSTFCSDIAHLGEVGHGQVAKALNNMMLWVTSVGLIEAGRIAESTGIDLPALRDALMMSSAKSQALEDWDQTTFTWALKDMQIVMGMSDAANLTLPITGAVKECVKEARHVKATDPPKWTSTPKN